MQLKQVPHLWVIVHRALSYTSEVSNTWLTMAANATGKQIVIQDGGKATSESLFSNAVKHMYIYHERNGSIVSDQYGNIMQFLCSTFFINVPERIRQGFDFKCYFLCKKNTRLYLFKRLKI